MRLNLRYARHAAAPLRRGLHLMGVGAGLGGLAIGYQVALVATAGYGHPLPATATLGAVAFAGLAGAMIAAGATLPLWASTALAPWRWARQARSLRRLAPLWRALSAAVPDVALESGDSLAEFGRRQIGIRLYRRVIEIRDAQLVLVAGAAPAVARRAEQAGCRRGLAGDDLRAYVEAATLRSALDAARARAGAAPATVRADAPATVRADAPAGVRVEPAARPPLAGSPAVDRDASLSAECRYLEKVAAAFAQLEPGRSGAGASRPG
jgi:hypothetical protein